MSSETIKKVLASGVCPECSGEIGSIYKEKETIYHCIKDADHFILEVMFHGGEKITAKLNNVQVPEDELVDIDW